MLSKIDLRKDVSFYNAGISKVELLKINFLSLSLVTVYCYYNNLSNKGVRQESLDVTENHIKLKSEIINIQSY